MRAMLPVVAFGALVAGSGPALAQPGDEAFHEQTLRALERIERALERLERRLDAPAAPGGGASGRDDDEVVAATSEGCGTTMANCQREALRYCERLNYRRGVPLRIEARGMFNYMVRVRCFN